MSVSRGKFLRSLGRAIPGLALGTGIAAAEALVKKVSSASGPVPGPESETSEKLPDVPFIHHGPSDYRRVAITFDDGPTPGVTDRILDELKQRNVSATFFMIGDRITAEPDLARRVIAEGHEVGNHTLTHPNLTTLPGPQVEREIQKTQEIIGSTLNQRAVWFRPPLGALRKDQALLLQSKGLGIIFWNVDPRDWSQPGETKIIETILSDTKPGSIILCHDLYAQTANSVGLFVDGLLERGFELVTLSTLLQQQRAHDSVL